MRSARIVVLLGTAGWAAACCLFAGAAVAAPAEVTALRVDSAAEPLGIDDPAPRLSWQLRSDRRGARQTAYEVQVAASGENLAAGPYVWDSGRVESDQSVAVPYDPSAGEALASGTRYVWRVRVWDELGEASAWSETGSWEMALLGSGAWQGADWITTDAATDAETWADYELNVDFTIAHGAAGVLFHARDANNLYMWQIALEGGDAVLRPHLREEGSWLVFGEVPLDGVIPESEQHLTHHLRLRLEGRKVTTWIDGVEVDQRELDQPGVGGVGFRSGGSDEDASFENLAVTDLEGEALFSDVFATAPDPAFPGAEVDEGKLRARGGALDLIDSGPMAPLLRKEFHLDQPLAQVASARAYVDGLGLYELRLSGAKAGDRVLAPPVTSYAHSLSYQTYDVTELLREGNNALGITLAEGYGPRFSQFGERWLGPRQVRLLLDVRFADGSHQRVITDESWHWGKGPIVDASLYGGETYDARALPAGWDEPGFDETGWRPTATTAAPAGTLQADPTLPIRIVRTLQPVSVDEVAGKPGAYVFDFGEEISGWARLRVEGATGTKVRMRFAEELDAEGALDTYTNRRAKATDTYVLAGGGEEVYEPSFTYHGFRYVEVTGLPEPPTAETLAARVVHADMESTASFESSIPLLDQIFANNARTMANNAMGAPTDNPVRDERTSPPMDVRAYEAALVQDYGAERYLSAYLDEIDAGLGGSPEMNAAFVPIAWDLYRQYGDRRVLADSFASMAGAVDAYVDEADEYVWPEPEPETFSGGFGDWCPPVPTAAAEGGLGGWWVGGYEACFSEVSLVNTALGYSDAATVAKAAAALGLDAEAAHYGEVADAIAAAFRSRFADADGYGSGRQVTSILPLALGITAADRRQLVSERLVERILGPDGGHLDTGIFGTRYLIDGLVAAGRPDVALTMLTQTTYPSYGFQIAHGATTAWEQWLVRSSMETHDHAMFSGINASFITQLAGIEPTEPGYATFSVAPVAPAGLDHVAATLETVRGRVASSYSREEGRFVLEVTVPPNSRAQVRVPTEPGDEVRESGEIAAASPGVSLVATGPEASVYSVGAGEHRFVASQPDPAPESPEQPSSPSGSVPAPPRSAGDPALPSDPARTPPRCRGREATIVGSRGDDDLVGTPGPDVIVAGRGEDRIRGLGGDDVICAGAGRDEVLAGAGDDLVFGGAGDDLLRGQRGQDRLAGNRGRDRLEGNGGADLLRGGPAADRLVGGRGRVDVCDGQAGRDPGPGSGCERVLRIP